MRGVSSWCCSTKSSDLAALRSLMLQELTVQDPRLAPFESCGILGANIAFILLFIFSIHTTCSCSEHTVAATAPCG